jgi:hypothetical protein
MAITPLSKTGNKVQNSGLTLEKVEDGRRHKKKEVRNTIPHESISFLADIAALS